MEVAISTSFNLHNSSNFSDLTMTKRNEVLYVQCITECDITMVIWLTYMYLY